MRAVLIRSFGWLAFLSGLAFAVPAGAGFSERPRLSAQAKKLLEQENYVAAIAVLEREYAACDANPRFTRKRPDGGIVYDCFVIAYPLAVSYNATGAFAKTLPLLAKFTDAGGSAMEPAACDALVALGRDAECALRIAATMAPDDPSWKRLDHYRIRLTEIYAGIMIRAGRHDEARRVSLYHARLLHQGVRDLSARRGQTRFARPVASIDERGMMLVYGNSRAVMARHVQAAWALARDRCSRDKALATID